MATAKKKTTAPDVILDQFELGQGILTARIIGVTPLIYNSMNRKVMCDLLSPRKKTAAEKSRTIKHNPLAEFRRSMYFMEDADAPTLCAFPAVAFKRALASAAIDVGGLKRTQMERLVWAVGESISVWGVPELRMDVVRSADMNRTPDVRTRAILRSWCCELTLRYVEPAVTGRGLASLLSAAGMVRGIGDFRQEKGAGNYGQFRLSDEEGVDAKRFDSIVKSGGRAEQVAAYQNPGFYNSESEELYLWWKDDCESRGLAVDMNEGLEKVA